MKILKSMCPTVFVQKARISRMGVKKIYDDRKWHPALGIATTWGWMREFIHTMDGVDQDVNTDTGPDVSYALRVYNTYTSPYDQDFWAIHRGKPLHVYDCWKWQTFSRTSVRHAFLNSHDITDTWNAMFFVGSDFTADDAARALSFVASRSMLRGEKNRIHVVSEDGHEVSFEGSDLIKARQNN